MSEIKKLKTTTVFNIARPYIEILTYYQRGGEEEESIQFFISTIEQTLEGVTVHVGDLVMKTTGNVVDVFHVDEDGYLIVDSNKPDQYYISKLDGTLIRDI